MAYCLNPDCPHKKKTGNPAEFQEGITHCSDCGSLLSEELIEKNDIQKAPPRRIIPTNLHKRILYTIGLVLLWRVLLLIPVPGINLQALGSLLGDEGSNSIFKIFGLGSALERISVFTLGVMPYLSAYMIVEILSVFVQPLKSWRDKGYQGRIKIKRVALFATFLFAVLAGLGKAMGFESTQGVAGETIVLAPGWSFRIIATVTLTAGTFLTIWIAELITRKGIGHGISILILTGFAGGFLSYITQIYSLFQVGHVSPVSLLLCVSMIIVIVAVIVFMERSKRKIPVRFNDGTEAYIPLKLTAAGIIPASGGEWLIGLLISILGVWRIMDYKISQKLLEAFTGTGIWYYTAYGIIIIFFYYLFVSFFYNPKDMIAVLKNKRASIVSPSRGTHEDYIDKSLESMIPVGALYLILIVFIPKIASRFLFFIFGGTFLIIAVAILLDLIEETRTRRKETNLIKVAELHDVPMAGLVKSLLEQKGLPCYLRGYYHRALLYFFGPYIEISVLVPEDRVTDATEVIENYLDANMLTVHFQ